MILTHHFIVILYILKVKIKDIITDNNKIDTEIYIKNINKQTIYLKLRLKMYKK